MTRHDPTVSLRHMLDSASEATEMIRGRERRDLDEDRMLNLALVRLLEIVGEAAARVPKSDRQKYKQIPWPMIVGLRNRLIHGYDQVNLDVLWKILADDVPPLIAELEKLLPADNEDN